MGRWRVGTGRCSLRFDRGVRAHDRQEVEEGLIGGSDLKGQVGRKGHELCWLWRWCIASRKEALG